MTEYLVSGMYIFRASGKFILRYLCLTLVGTTIVGCAGIVHQVVFEPGGHERYLTYDLIDTEITVFPVVVSEKLNSLYGPGIMLPTPTSEWNAVEEPLSIDLWVKVKRGTAKLNLQDATIRLSNEGRTLEPIGIMSKTIHHFPDKSSVLSYKDIDGKVTALERDKPYRYVIMYGVERDVIDPFEFHLGSIKLNGQTIHKEPFIFSRATRYISK